MERNFETVMIEQCAPVLAGLKPAGLFRYETRDCADLARRVRSWNEQLASKGLSVRVLKGCVRTHQFLIYVYREARLRVIFADEPTGNLDSITSKQVLYRMLQISKQMGTTFVMVTHEPELASCADRIITILDGKVQSDVVQDPATRERNREALFASLEGNMRIGGDSASGEVHQKTAAELASYAAPAAAAQQPEQPKP